MNTENKHKEPDGTLTSESLAVLIIDGLVDAGLIDDGSFEEAVKIATLEINIRKHAGDY
ncbi:MAG: hypothetical protein ACK502_07050 [Alphaproteobacteria bacterium]